TNLSPSAISTLTLHDALPICRQQPRGFQIEQGGGDDEELRGLVEVPLLSQFPGVGDEIVGDLVQGYLGDVQSVLRDELQQQIERTLEIVQPHLETARGSFGVGSFLAG